MKEYVMTHSGDNTVYDLKADSLAQAKREATSMVNVFGDGDMTISKDFGSGERVVLSVKTEKYGWSDVEL